MGWERLHSLWLQRNLLQALPESLCRLRSLTTLVLSGNRLRQLPLAMEAMTGLTFVNLRDNPLEPAVSLPDPVPTERRGGPEEEEGVGEGVGVEEVEEVEKFGMDFMRHYLRTLRTELDSSAGDGAAETEAGRGDATEGDAGGDPGGDTEGDTEGDTRGDTAGDTGGDAAFVSTLEVDMRLSCQMPPDSLPGAS
ncbi:leucine-rich repeat-containing protein 39-like [Lethenteron reissneri]|uniref:leucine-rich repeat-containing protein 39-like n=1 Tax=Lethenteron reissneri TaxID=7753 RepID=UPI002AB60333|nr:leucine-rich repeat-containing protein 39-like [Lethenteron reissneri]